MGLQGFRRCDSCKRPVPSFKRFCNGRTCPRYGPLWAGDQRRKLFGNLELYDQDHHGKGQVLLVTVTAPGVDRLVDGGPRLPWDEDHCRALGPHKHSGLIGCRVHPVVGNAWNRAAPPRWSELHRVAAQDVRRRGLRLTLIARVWEMQHRQALHVHPLLGFTTGSEKAGAIAYQRRLAELSPAYGFGNTDRKREVRSAGSAAAYLSSYFVTGKQKKPALQESVKANGMPRSIIYVSQALTTRSGITMRNLRLRRFAWHLCTDHGQTYASPASVDNVLSAVLAGVISPRGP